MFFYRISIFNSETIPFSLDKRNQAPHFLFLNPLFWSLAELKNQTNEKNYLFINLLFCSVFPRLVLL